MAEHHSHVDRAEKLRAADQVVALTGFRATANDDNAPNAPVSGGAGSLLRFASVTVLGANASRRSGVQPVSRRRRSPHESSARHHAPPITRRSGTREKREKEIEGHFEGPDATDRSRSTEWITRRFRIESGVRWWRTRTMPVGMQPFKVQTLRSSGHRTDVLCAAVTSIRPREFLVSVRPGCTDKRRQSS